VVEQVVVDLTVEVVELEDIKLELFLYLQIHII
jgi:hypothetical protein